LFDLLRVAGVMNRIGAKKNKASAARTNAGAKYFFALHELINQLLMPPACIGVAGQTI